MTLHFDDRDRESVLRDLVDEDEEVRRLAVERIGVLPTEESISRLVERLGDPSWRVRKAAVARLVACPDTTRVVDALMLALADGENTGRRNAAVEALVECGSRAIPQLVSVSGDDDVDVRKLVVDALAGIGDPRSTPWLIGMLADPDANVRAAAADALGAIGGPDAADALRRIAIQEEEDQLVRFSALHAMAALEVPIRAAEFTPVLDDPILRPAGLALLGRAEDDEAEAVVLKALGSSSRSVREAAIQAILRILPRMDGAEMDRFTADICAAVAASPLVIESAIARLADATLSTRLMLIQFLGLVKAKQAVVPVLLAGEDEALSQVATSTLEMIGAAAETEIDSVWNELDLTARRNACLLFGRLKGDTSAARLLAALEDPAPELRNAAARSIGQRGLVDALPVLVRRLGCVGEDDDFESDEEIDTLTDALIQLANPTPDSDSEAPDHAIRLLTSNLDGAAERVRIAIATVIGRIGRRQDAQVVELLLKDPSPLVRRAAVDALARLEHGSAAESLHLALGDESPAVRIAAAGALGASQSDEVIGDLKRLTEDEEPRVRAAALRAVGTRFRNSTDAGHRATVANLLDAALDDDAEVALAALESLRDAGRPLSEGMMRILDRPEPELLQEVVHCIGASGDAWCLEALLPLVSHPDWSVRAETIQVLADRGVTKAVPAILRRLETEQDEFVRDAMLRALKKLEE